MRQQLGQDRQGRQGGRQARPPRHAAVAGRRRAHPVGEPGGDQTKERLTDLELDQSGLVDDLLHIASAVDQRQQPLLLCR